MRCNGGAHLTPPSPASHSRHVQLSDAQWQRMQREGLQLLRCEMRPRPRNVLSHHLKLAVRWWGRLPPWQLPPGGGGGACDGSDGFGWLYLGSANHSPSAWGRPLERTVRPRLGRSEGTKDTCLQIFNYELGVLFVQLPPWLHAQRGGGRAALAMCPLPWQGPFEYGAHDLPATTTFRKLVRVQGGGGRRGTGASLKAPP